MCLAVKNVKYFGGRGCQDFRLFKVRLYEGVCCVAEDNDAHNTKVVDDSSSRPNRRTRWDQKWNFAAPLGMEACPEVVCRSQMQKGRNAEWRWGRVTLKKVTVVCTGESLISAGGEEGVMAVTVQGRRGEFRRH